ncbi:9339_t:CDS:2, partial [Entrophospora sp. SA101]
MSGLELRSGFFCGDTSDSEPESQISTPQSKNNDLLKKAHSMHYNPFDSQIAEIDSMLAG